MAYKRKAKRRRRSRSSSLRGLKPAMRMKGGVRFDPTINGFVAIVHTWDNADCRGAPEEWRYPEVFPTEEAAMRCYKTSIRPILEQLMAEFTERKPDVKIIQRRLEE